VANSIKFDSTEIRNTTYVPRFVKHESATEREIIKLALARDNGSVMVSDRYAEKIITLQGILTAATQSALETAIDTMKELFGRKEKNLDIDWEASTRRYVATCQKLEFDRDHFHNSFVPWTAEFVVLSGVGKTTSITAEKHAVSLNANPYSFSSTFGGSAKPRPVVTLEIGAGHTLPRGIELKNTDTGEKIVYTKQSGVLVNGDTILFDFSNKKVTREAVEEGFYGLFPSLIIGANALQLQVGDIIDQFSTPPVSVTTDRMIFGDIWTAHSFVVPYTDKSYRKNQLYIKKTGTPPNALQVRIETDNGGKPSGSLVSANAYGTIAAADVGTDLAWEVSNMNADIELTAGTRYWLLAKMTAGDASNCFNIGLFTKNYNKGNIAYSNNAGVAWAEYTDQNVGFRVCYGGSSDASLGTITLDVDYYKEFI